MVTESEKRGLSRHHKRERTHKKCQMTIHDFEDDYLNFGDDYFEDDDFEDDYLKIKIKLKLK